MNFLNSPKNFFIFIPPLIFRAHHRTLQREFYHTAAKNAIARSKKALIVNLYWHFYVKITLHFKKILSGALEMDRLGISDVPRAKDFLGIIVSFQAKKL
jgi:hypothetical protein